jgi:transaldolase
MRVAIAADHAGYALKERLREHLAARGHEVLDLGARDAAPSDYPDHAEAAGLAVLDGRAERAIVVCGSGVGVAAAANKLPGIVAGMCHDAYSAHQGVEHDAMNVLALGARVVADALALELADAFLAARFDGEERHRRRVAKVRALEARFTGGGHVANPLRELERFGQSVWYDGLRRGMLASGELARLVADDGLAGLTTNPAIYEKAIVETNDYDAELATLLPRADLDAKAVYEALAIHDLQAAADLLRPVYEGASRRDGYVSLEVAPAAARDERASLDEARRLWRALGRENAMIKVPGTREAVPAIRRLLAEGVNVNVTLLFSREAYRAVAEAHLQALEERASRGEDLSKVASVASFFVSRIDSEVDRRLDAIAAGDAPEETRRRARSLRGRIAIANAKLAYQDWRALVATPRWRRLRERGAMPQRLLWASTSTKDPRYRDVMYVEELVGPETVDTMPPATFDAFRDHGRVAATLEADVDGARAAVAELAALGISLDEVTARLLEDGVRLFAEPFARLLATLDARREAGAAAGAHP